jgi:hypothetical protein
MSVRHLSETLTDGNNGTVCAYDPSTAHKAAIEAVYPAGAFLVWGAKQVSRLEDNHAPRKTRRSAGVRPWQVGSCGPLTSSSGSGAHRVYSLSDSWRSTRPGRRARDRRRRERNQPMHEEHTIASEIGEKYEQLTAQLTAFNRVLLRGVKSKSPHGRGINSDLTDLTDSLIGKDIQGRVRARARAATESSSLASERIGKIGKIGPGPRAVMRFAVNRARSNGVEPRLISGKIGGWSA